MSADLSPTRRLLDHLLPGGLDAYVARKRAAGRSWRLIALDIHDDVGVDLTPQALHSWFPAETPPAKLAAKRRRRGAA